MPSDLSLMPRFKSSKFYQNKPKIKLYLLKNKIFRVLGALPPDPQWPPVDKSGAPRPQKHPLPPLLISGCAPDTN